MSETVTIRVDRETLQVLERLKKDKRARSYAEVIRTLIKESGRVPQSERGAFPKLRPFKRDKRSRSSEAHRGVGGKPLRVT